MRKIGSKKPKAPMTGQEAIDNIAKAELFRLRQIEPKFSISPDV